MVQETIGPSCHFGKLSRSSFDGGPSRLAVSLFGALFGGPSEGACSFGLFAGMLAGASAARFRASVAFAEGSFEGASLGEGICVTTSEVSSGNSSTTKCSAAASSSGKGTYGSAISKHSGICAFEFVFRHAKSARAFIINSLQLSFKCANGSQVASSAGKPCHFTKKYSSPVLLSLLYRRTSSTSNSTWGASSSMLPHLAAEIKVLMEV
mmetsp:Transcript_105100/g.165837  ORF Transcript_105100/g.165837 Transcript_105100/m.165837 type:complete len:209 (+) Transcript_105100:335-961(+)